MNVLELAIIYLALGAPVGVYYVTTHPAEAALASVANGTLNVVLWPLYLALFVYARFRDDALRPKSLQDLRATLETSASEHLSADEMRSFRYFVARYVALSEAVEMPVGTSAVEGLAEVGLLRSKNHAVAGFRRRNRERLIRQQADARVQLSAALSRVPALGPTAVELAALLHDELDVNQQRLDRPTHLTSSQKIDPARVSIAA